MKWFINQKLKVKFTLVIGLIVFIPIVIIYSMQFGNMEKTRVDQLKGAVEDSLAETYSEIQKTVDLCNMSTQMFLNNQNLNDFLSGLKKGEDFETEEIVSFYQNDIAMLEKLVNSNPYLYRIRVYAENDDFLEMMPILFRHQRMEAFPWADSYVSGQWQFDYDDHALEGVSARSMEHIMSLVTTFADYELGETGVLEVAVDMTQIFPQLFAEEENQWGCFVAEDGIVYSGSNREGRWNELEEEILSEAFSKEEAGEVCRRAKVGDEPVVIAAIPVKELSGQLVYLVSIKDELRKISEQRDRFLVILTVIFVLAVLVINWVVKKLLKGFYDLMEIIRHVQEGDLDVRVSATGNDEIGELGGQINKMLDRIRTLIEENVNRERLMKNSEIRALQNQINAHFIYNVLESIKMMAEIDEEYAISDAVTSLGRLLRYSMRWVSQEVTVRQEIQYVQDYLELMNLRYDYEIILSLKISDLVYMQKIPKMSLQPIVENAICHGIEELAEDASIYIKAVEYKDYFEIEITDSGRGMTQEQVRTLEEKIAGKMEISGGSGNGIGLKNVQDRIHVAFGERYGIRVASKEGCYTKVIVKVPITQREESVEG
ncbi:MAG: histidine kinase [Eubacteriales bacterium]|nr:histidine kinase [Eubacteriales bacterium]